MSHAQYYQDWEERKAQRICSLFSDESIERSETPSLLEALRCEDPYEEKEPQVISESLRSSSSSLPDLIIEVEPKYDKHDDPPEYYARIHKNIMKAYRRRFIEGISDIDDISSASSDITEVNFHPDISGNISDESNKTEVIIINNVDNVNNVESISSTKKDSKDKESRYLTEVETTSESDIIPHREVTFQADVHNVPRYGGITSSDVTNSGYSTMQISNNNLTIPSQEDTCKSLPKSPDFQAIPMKPLQSSSARPISHLTTEINPNAKGSDDSIEDKQEFNENSIKMLKNEGDNHDSSTSDMALTDPVQSSSILSTANKRDVAADETFKKINDEHIQSNVTNENPCPSQLVQSINTNEMESSLKLDTDVKSDKISQNKLTSEADAHKSAGDHKSSIANNVPHSVDVGTGSKDFLKVQEQRDDSDYFLSLVNQERHHIEAMRSPTPRRCSYSSLPNEPALDLADNATPEFKKRRMSLEHISEKSRTSIVDAPISPPSKIRNNSFRMESKERTTIEDQDLVENKQISVRYIPGNINPTCDSPDHASNVPSSQGMVPSMRKKSMDNKSVVYQKQATSYDKKPAMKTPCRKCIKYKKCHYDALLRQLKKCFRKILGRMMSSLNL